MDSSQLELVRTRLERLRGQWGRVARESGIGYTTIKNIMQGSTKDPRSSTVERLRTYLVKEGA